MLFLSYQQTRSERLLRTMISLYIPMKRALLNLYNKKLIKGKVKSNFWSKKITNSRLTISSLSNSFKSFPRNSINNSSVVHSRSNAGRKSPLNQKKKKAYKFKICTKKSKSTKNKWPHLSLNFMNKAMVEIVSTTTKISLSCIWKKMKIWETI
jgi:hypothetical protein